ncbi:TatD family hydrolase, partial [Brachyspira pilosicoli]
MIDSHCHLTYISKKAKDLKEVLERANKAGIYYFVDIGVHPSDIDERLYILSDAEGVFFSMGYYPDYANENDEHTIKAFELKIKTINKKTLENRKKLIYAVGEIGLDYYHDDSNKEEQKKFFSALCNAAKNVDLPILIHSRDAFKDTFSILKEADIPKR